MVDRAPITVVETPEFRSATRKLLTRDECSALVNHLAHHPTDGDLIQGTGGVRKLRWALDGRGKRGGARIIYFYHDPDLPVFMLTAYAKNERSNLSQKDRTDMRRLTTLLVQSYARSHT